MNIIDLRQNDTESSHVSFEPLRSYDKSIILRKYIEKDEDIYIDGFYKYDLTDKTFHRFDNTSSKIDYAVLWYYYSDNIYFTTSKVIDDRVLLTFHELDIKNEVQRVVMEIDFTLDQSFSILEIFDGHIIYFLEDGVKKEDYDVDKDIIGDYCNVFIYDFINKKTYEVYDRSIRLSVGFFEIFDKGEDEYFMIEEKYMEEWEKEEAFNDNASPDDFTRGYRDSIRIIKCRDFINQIKAGNEFIECTDIDSKGVNGSVSYIIMDDERLYYSKKDFMSGKSELVCLNVDDLTKKTYPLPKGYKYLRVDNNHAFAVMTRNNLVIAKDIINKDFIISYPYPDSSNGGEALYGLVDDKYILIDGVKEDGDEISNYTKIYNIETGDLIENTGKLAELNEDVILY